jgi:hypothetical protein
MRSNEVEERADRARGDIGPLLYEALIGLYACLRVAMNFHKVAPCWSVTSKRNRSSTWVQLEHISRSIVRAIIFAD